MKRFAFSDSEIVVSRSRSMLASPTVGAVVSFEGLVRDHNDGRAVRSLEYQAYERLALTEGDRIVTEAIEAPGVHTAYCVHRTGHLVVGDLAVWVGVSARHRAEAFLCCRRIIDEVKSKLPIWKKEFYVDGDSGWVDCEGCVDSHSLSESV